MTLVTGQGYFLKRIRTADPLFTNQGFRAHIARAAASRGGCLSTADDERKEGLPPPLHHGRVWPPPAPDPAPGIQSFRHCRREPHTGEAFARSEKAVLDVDIRCRWVSGLRPLVIEIPA